MRDYGAHAGGGDSVTDPIRADRMERFAAEHPKYLDW